jgi:hypothetical protein
LVQFCRDLNVGNNHSILDVHWQLNIVCKNSWNSIFQLFFCLFLDFLPYFLLKTIAF